MSGLRLQCIVKVSLMSETIVAGFHYTLKDKDGNEIDSSAGKSPLYVMLGKGHIVKGLDEILPTLEAGDKRNIIVSPEDGYGAVNEELRLKVPRNQFPPDANIKLRDQFQTSQEPGAPVYTVMHIDEEDNVYIDGNHPLAGHELHFDIEIVEKRPADAEEIAHGHAHGPDGHGH